MSQHDVYQYLCGALAMSAVVVALFFLRFWRVSRDRLFVYFTAAFVLLAANWTALAAIAPSRESRHFVYLIRLVAFLLLAFGIWDKNKGGDR
jgi:hypothetical protein